MVNLLKAIYRFNALPIKIPTQFFAEPFSFKKEKTNKQKKTAKMILNNKITSGAITLQDFKLYYRPIVIKTV